MTCCLFIPYTCRFTTIKRLKPLYHVCKMLTEMASGGQLSREEALACSGVKHACHVMLYASTRSLLFGRTPFRHIILMQMRFDGLLGFPGGLVEPDKETLEAGLSRELLEEMGVDLPMLEEEHVCSCFAPPRPGSPHSTLILHFYVKKVEEQQILEVERAAVTTASDHGHEVLGMVRVPLYSLRDGKGLGSFLSHGFIGNARSQLVDTLLRLEMVGRKELCRALAHALKAHSHSARDLKEALAMAEAREQHH